MTVDRKYLTYHSAWQRAYVLKQTISLSERVSKDKLEKIKKLSDSFKNKSMESYELLLNKKSNDKN